MNLHKHARLTPRGRALLVQRMLNGLRVEDAAQAAGVSVRTAYKWLRRFREEGEIGLMDRSSRPHSCPHATAIALVEQLIELRRSRKTYRQIAQILGLAVSTVARRLKQAGFHRLAELEPAPVVVRYEYANPGDLLHLDIKKLGRFWKPGHRVTGDRQQCSDGAGWEFMHVAIDDASRLAFTSLHPDERGSSACRALLQALRYYRGLNICFRRVMTDNGACYRSRAFQRLCARLGLKHIRTKPYTPRTNGKAERFIQTSLREWAYARSYDTSQQRAAHLLPWLHHYNWHRLHASLGYLPPISRAPLPLNNVLGLHS
ncbi:IS2 transposase TnpB [Pseudomonas sp. THAF187a]|uniref:IS481 family transposase n=1 Tax=unclassified Pseudomonas TaxID=196821 RepID=UPI00126961FA|nr:MULTISPECIES: IS481 family transposase [unclassified Pseudomonas]QFT20241.1 IS2 transposase TnpB [Pseudomonas sp. THAF187a]QFT21450.1 IS2 transposase TnpB [Pseudomonas sp. THAF187a]QFT22215.1 IS2 transposase TnpB [Pseudomonas sp. THAF187a]QFT40432.1 IS2 transposase TnpB [Pseudomonas sp. THAF42]QFT41638.1 IS2 transposase TnpB [Pseudomonas sp. THAF42]